MTLSDVLMDTLARIVMVSEAISLGDTEFAFDLLHDLEADLQAELDRIREAA